MWFDYVKTKVLTAGLKKGNLIPSFWLCNNLFAYTFIRVCILRLKSINWRIKGKKRSHWVLKSWSNKKFIKTFSIIFFSLQYLSEIISHTWLSLPQKMLRSSFKIALKIPLMTFFYYITVECSYSCHFQTLLAIANHEFFNF